MRLTAFFLCAFCMNAIADWQVIESTDRMTDERSLRASTTLLSGHSFSITRMIDGTVWAILALPNTPLEIHGTRLPQYRIDKLKAEDVDDLKRLEKLVKKPMVMSSTRSVAWLVWSGKGQPNTGTLRNIMDGQTILIRYTKFPDDTAEVEFNLKGAKESIAKAIAVPEDVDQIAAEKERNERHRYSEAMRKCLDENRNNRSGFNNCMDGVRKDSRSQ